MAAKPAILAVDDDAPVLRSIERDLRARYGATYRVLAAGSGAEALEATRELTRRGDSVALFVVDQRMPTMTGIELLREALPLQPEAKRILLTAYADTEAAIQAINDIRLDQYVLKPWDPPEERLYPVLDDLLADWTASFRPPFEGLRLLSGRWAPRGHAIRDFLTRNQVPYAWHDPEADEEGRRLAGTVDGPVDPGTPVVFFADGRALRGPSNRDLADAIGLSTHASLPFYDLVIVGGGPAGLAAAVYGASEGLKTLMIEREAPGGQAGTTSRIENYLGFPSGLSGGDLARRALAQARRLGAEILSSQEAASLRRDDPYRTLVLAEDGGEISCQTVIIASGVSYRQLEVPGAAELAGRGVYYGAATTEAILYRDAPVAVIGAGNSAGQAAVHLARYASRVHVVVRGQGVEGSMSAYLVEQMRALDNVEIHAMCVARAFEGTEHLERATFVAPDGELALELAAAFVFIGQQPRTGWLEGVVARDERGFILTGPDVDARQGWNLDRDPFLLESSIPGVFAAGDVRHDSVKRIASAVGEGAMALQYVHHFLAQL
jgi:thioredoxin reductase (NADPH)